MKIILDEKDKRYANCINEALENNETVPIYLTRKNTKYYLEFTCTDVGKANAFIMHFMDKNADIEKINNEVGINVIGVSSNNSIKDSINEILANTISKIDDI